MYDEQDDMMNEVPDWEDDALGNFCPGDYAIIDKGYPCAVSVIVVSIGDESVLVEDQFGQQYPVNVLRLSK